MTSDALAWTDGWWSAATRRASPNFDSRPAETRVKLVVLHHISLPAGQFDGDLVCDFFENRLDVVRCPMLSELADMHVSAHFFVRRTGEVMQFVSCDDRAWHAGISTWRGQRACNDFSIGVEIEGDAVAPFADAQYSALDSLLVAIKQNYPITAVTTHSEIAPGRKIDPGPTFDWSRLGGRWHA
jgi:N-acetyl-anhydromuramoyl-L-alanine amidase